MDGVIKKYELKIEPKKSEIDTLKEESKEDFTTQKNMEKSIDYRSKNFKEIINKQPKENENYDKYLDELYEKYTEDIKELIEMNKQLKESNLIGKQNLKKLKESLDNDLDHEKDLEEMEKIFEKAMKEMEKDNEEDRKYYKKSFDELNKKIKEVNDLFDELDKLCKYL